MAVYTAYIWVFSDCIAGSCASKNFCMTNKR